MRCRCSRRQENNVLKKLYMKKELRVYGDSFVATHTTPSVSGHHKINWTRYLAEKLNYDEINRGVSGCSNAVIFSRIYEDIKSNKINNDSTGAIIVSVSSTGRFFNHHTITNKPHAGSVYVTALDNEITTLVDNDDYFAENKEHIKWAILENHMPLEILTLEAFLFWLKYYFTENYPNIKIIVMFFTASYSLDFASLKDTDNFVCCSNFSLIDASFNEYKENTKNYREFVKYTIVDPRANHLTSTNRERLAEATYNIIQNGDKRILHNDLFEKNIVETVKNLKEYLNYVEQGLYHFDNNIIRRSGWNYPIDN